MRRLLIDICSRLSSERKGGLGQLSRRLRAHPAFLPIVLAAVTATAATTYAVGMVWPAATVVGLPALAASHERAAANALLAPGVDYDLATRENDAALSEAPLTSTAWIRRAYIAHQKANGLTPETIDSLRASYLAAPLGPDVSDWRLAYAFDSWPQLPPDLRAKATDEMSAYARFNPNAAALVRNIKSPSGRLAASLIMRRIDGRILQAPLEARRVNG